MAYELRSIDAAYGDLSVLSGLSLALPEATVTVMLGPSGCGKTTLLNVIAGLKEPEGGERLGFGGCRFSYAFQEDRLLPWLDARANLDFALAGSGLPEAARNSRIERFLGAAGLADSASRRPSELSGGMRRRLSLARAFAFPSDLLLLDEAFQAVDLRMKLELMDLFSKLLSEESRTVVCVTHDVEEAAYLADFAVVLSARPARVVDRFAVAEPRGRRSLGSGAALEAESRLYRLALGRA
jgi:NitT/TauT family transport system ATP-binding protein